MHGAQFTEDMVPCSNSRSSSGSNGGNEEALQRMYREHADDNMASARKSFEDRFYGLAAADFGNAAREYRQAGLPGSAAAAQREERHARCMERTQWPFLDTSPLDVAGARRELAKARNLSSGCAEFPDAKARVNTGIEKLNSYISSSNAPHNHSQSSAPPIRGSETIDLSSADKHAALNKLSNGRQSVSCSTITDSKHASFGPCEKAEAALKLARNGGPATSAASREKYQKAADLYGAAKDFAGQLEILLEGGLPPIPNLPFERLYSAKAGPDVLCYRFAAELQSTIDAGGIVRLYKGIGDFNSRFEKTCTDAGLEYVLNWAREALGRAQAASGAPQVNGTKPAPDREKNVSLKFAATSWCRSDAPGLSQQKGCIDDPLKIGSDTYSYKVNFACTGPQYLAVIGVFDESGNCRRTVISAKPGHETTLVNSSRPPCVLDAIVTADQSTQACYRQRHDGNACSCPH